MGEFVEPLFLRHGRGPISSSPLLVDANQDGWPEIFVGGRVLQGLTWNGEPLPRWPKRGRRPFAASPAFEDLGKEGRGKILVGCDDGCIYAFYVDGDPVPGWPVQTGADVFSTPAAADVDGDGVPEAVVGSDDGCLYVLRGDGSILSRVVIPERPFVSASPTVLEARAKEPPSVVTGAWDRCLHAWTARCPNETRVFSRAGHVVWSSGTAFRLADAGPSIAWASDAVYLTMDDGSDASGWPRKTRSWMVSSPCVAELRPGAGATVLVGSDRLYAWDLGGRGRPGWPVDVGDFVWSSPIALDLDGNGDREVVVGSWDGGIYAFRPDGSLVPGFPLRTKGPIFATLAAAPLPSGGGLLVGTSWDGGVYAWRLPSARFASGDWLQFRGSPSRTGFQTKTFERDEVGAATEPPRPGMPRIHAARLERWAGVHRIALEGQNLETARRIEVEYRIADEGREHRVPAVLSRGRFVALIQPFRLPHMVRYRVELEGPAGHTVRWPEGRPGKFLGLPSRLLEAIKVPSSRDVDSVGGASPRSGPAVR